jgi:hypothetical protein
VQVIVRDCEEALCCNSRKEDLVECTQIYCPPWSKYSLDGYARQWYKTLPASSISSLKDFHAAFYSYYKKFYPVESLFEHCCEGYTSYTQYLVVDSSSSVEEGDDYAMEEEEDSFSIVSSSNFVLQQEDFQNSDIEADDNDTLDAFVIYPNVSSSSNYDTIVVPNLFESHIVDDSIKEHKYASFSLEIYQAAPVYDEYNDNEKELNVYEAQEDSLADEILSSFDFQKKDVQQCIHVAADDIQITDTFDITSEVSYSHGFVVQNVYGDLLVFYGYKDDLEEQSFASTHIELYKPLNDNLAFDSIEDSETIQHNESFIEYIVPAAEIYEDSLLFSHPDALALNDVKEISAQKSYGHIKGNFVVLDHNEISVDYELLQGDQVDVSLVNRT